MQVIDLTGRSLHYLCSSRLNVTLYMWTDAVKSILQIIVKSLSCDCGTDEQMLNTPECVQLIWQGCPLTLGIKPL